jgi:phosphoribosylglycinamide formyltransferase-1
VEKFPGRIINVHPALLPKFGGKGMYGRHVHEAVKKANEMESGISIHFVNEQFDEGAIIEQFRASLEHSDSAEEIERKVRELELNHYASVIEKVVLSKV